MHLLYCDESNLEPKGDDFFVYGGVAIDANKALSLSESVENIRRCAGVPKEFVLKFNPRPTQLDHKGFSGLKQAIIETARDHSCVFFTSLVLHRIATTANDARRNAVNDICYHFNCYLNRADSHGLVLLDRFEDGKIDSQLRERFSVGLMGMPYSNELKLDRIIGFHYSAIGQSHFGSIIDILLGSFRFALNAFTRGREADIPTARLLLALLAPMFLRENSDDRVSELSLAFRPKVVKSDAYRAQYEALRAFLGEGGVVAEQGITSERHY